MPRPAERSSVVRLTAQSSGGLAGRRFEAAARLTRWSS